eukprot:771096-Rhodomonas_salina.1
MSQREAIMVQTRPTVAKCNASIPSGRWGPQLTLMVVTNEVTSYRGHQCHLHLQEVPSSPPDDLSCSSC